MGGLIGGLLGILSMLVLVTALGFVLGTGIELKAALTYPIGLALMAIAALVIRCRPAPLPLATAARPALLLAALILLLALGRSVAWWTATHALADLLASTDAACIPVGPQQPFSLQWPWMAVIDDWTAPMQALAFRDPHWPSALLLPHDGCARLADDGIARLTDWLVVPADRLEANFGPLRR